MKRVGSWIFRFAAFLGFLQIAITVTPVLSYWNHALTGSWGSEEGETLIILGAEGLGYGVIGQTSYIRAYNAAIICRTSRFHKIVVAGKEAAPLMRDFLISQGIPGGSVVVEGESTSTRENALFVARLLQGDTGRKVLLTSDYHSRRAMMVFRKAGLDVSLIPSPDVVKRVPDLTQRWSIMVQLATETVKLGWYKMRGWI